MGSKKKQLMKDLHAGHRSRLYEKFEKEDFRTGNLKNHEILEMFLFMSVHRENTNDTSHRLLNTFGSVENVFKASPEMLREVRGVGKKTSELFADIACVFDLMRKEIYKGLDTCEDHETDDTQQE